MSNFKLYFSETIWLKYPTAVILRENKSRIIVSPYDNDENRTKYTFTFQIVKEEFFFRFALINCVGNGGSDTFTRCFPSLII